MSSQKSKSGFALMDRETLKAIASKGGKSAHAQGVAHEFGGEEARKAGAKGGNAVAKDRAHMAEIGRRGGKARQRRRGNPPTPE
jgi:general stress protein YciG